MPRRRRLILILSAAAVLIVATVVTVSFLWAGTSGPAPSSAKRVLIFGDSYTQGFGATPETDGFAYLVGPALGWDVTVDGVASTGYVNPGTNNQGTFVERLRSSPPAGQFDEIFVEGSSNDSSYPEADVAAAISEFLADLSARYPSATIALMGPCSINGKPPSSLLAVRDQVKQAAEARSLLFIDPIGEQWFTSADAKTLVNASNGHPNNAGYARIASKFEDDVSSPAT